MNNKELLKYFLENLISKDINKNTYESYKSDLNILLDFAGNKKLLDQDRIFIKEYTNYLRESFNSNGVYRKIASLKLFYKKLYENSMIETLITEDIKNYKLNNNLPDILSIEEIDFLLKAINTDDDKCKRDFVLINLLYETGIKMNEALLLTKENISSGKITINNKKRKHIIKISEKLSNILKEYFSRDICGNELIFQGLTRQNFFARIKKYALKAGIEKDVSPMKIRNSAMYHLIENGEDIKSIKEKLDYSNIGISSIYKIRNKNDIKKIYDEIAIGDWNV